MYTEMFQSLFLRHFYKHKYTFAAHVDQVTDAVAVLAYDKLLFLLTFSVITLNINIADLTVLLLSLTYPFVYFV